MALYGRLDPYERLDRGGDTVRHEFKFAIRRDKGDCAVVLESRQTNALMKLDIFHFDSFSAGGCGRDKDAIED